MEKDPPSPAISLEERRRQKKQREGAKAASPAQVYDVLRKFADRINDHERRIRRLENRLRRSLRALQKALEKH